MRIRKSISPAVRAVAALCLMSGLSGMGCKRAAPQNHPINHSTPKVKVETPVPTPKPTTNKRAATPTPPAAKSGPRAGQSEGLHFIEQRFGAKPGHHLPTLVLIHGLGDRPEPFIQLSSTIKTPHRALALRGLSEYSGSFGQGYAWFSTRVKEKKHIKKLAAEINHAATVVAKGLRALNKKEGQLKRRFVVTGFSQGGILSYALAVQYPELFAAALPVAGLLPPSARQLKGKARTQITAFHGQADQIVPFARAKALGQWLKQKNFEYTMHAIPGVGHRMPPPLLNPLRAALVQALNAMP